MGNHTSAPASRASRPLPQASFSNVVLANQPENVAPAPVEGVPVRHGIAPDASPPAAVPTNGERLALNITAEKEALASGEQHKMVAMLSLKAPTAPESAPRPPMDLVIAADRSGSMHGEKIRLMRQTLDLLVKRSGLNAEDRLSLVSFDSQVKLELPLESMDMAGRAKAEAVVRRLQPGATTNLSGGALKAIDVLDGSSPSKGNAEKRTRAVMLFTDGLANEGIRDTAALCTAVGGALRAASAKLGGPISLFTFGFGSDHSEDCLRNLANESGTAGQYYYVRTAEDIPNAFADCLGGLTSVVAQNAALSLETAGGATVTRVLGTAYTYTEGTISLGDLFAEDEKDILVELSLPKLPSPLEQPATIVKASLRAFNITRSAPEVIDATLEVGRPAATPPNQMVNATLDAQRNRIETAAAMEQASALADRGELEAGRSVLQAQANAILGSSSASEALSSNLVCEINSLESNFRSVSQYRAVGSKMSRMQARSHQIQRGNHMSAPTYNAGKSRKGAMKSMWGLSSISSMADDGDSD